MAWAAFVLCVALFLRVHAALTLPTDFDEGIYLRGAQAVADALKAGNLADLTEDAISPENPPLVKIVLGAVLAALPSRPPVSMDLNAPLPADLLIAARVANAVLGAAGAFALALVSPIAGGALALSSLHVRYTSEVLLEALPVSASIVCVLAYRRSGRAPNRWLWLSAAALGATAASKYIYCLCALAVLGDWAIELYRATPPERKRHLAVLGGWVGMSLMVFLALDPYLWPDPVGRLIGTLTFHRDNASSIVNTGKYVAWQPLAWLATPHLGRLWPPALAPDAAILVLAALGLPALWRIQRVTAIWLALGLVFLLAYSNKWPQYALIVIPALCASAEAALRLWVRRPAPAAARPRARRLATLALPAVTLAWTLWLGGNAHRADPDFLAAQHLVSMRMRSDEVALFMSANPSLELSTFLPGPAHWDGSTTRRLAAHETALDYDRAADWLGDDTRSKRGVWLVTYQASYADPADNARALLQRRAHLLSPALEETFGNSYRVTHYRFDDPYQPPPRAVEFEAAVAAGTATVESAYGQSVGLTSDGCLVLRDDPAAAANRRRWEMACLWRMQPWKALDWQTKVSVRLRNAAGDVVAQADHLIARSGFPTARFEGRIFGVYPLEVPASLPAGRYGVAVFAYGSGQEYSPRVIAWRDVP